MKELALHLLDIAENSVAARAQTITIAVDEDEACDRLSLSVEDDGCGMDAETVKRVRDPFVTSRTTRKVGLGIPFLEAAAQACNGGLRIDSRPGAGTRIEADFQLNHIDRMPLGDLASTWLALLVANPQVHWIFRYRARGGEFVFDDGPVKQELDGVPMTEPAVLAYIREWLEGGVAGVQAAGPESQRA
jgi:hypothetical protein